MDFGALLHVAKRNSEGVKNSEGKYYSTKFSAPKKETKEKKLSDNIKKFLVKKEHEEREKARDEKQKRDQLLAMRDDRAKNKIKKMLKVIKSANKSVLEDAVDNDNTAVTLQGPDQPDEDDYGYVSRESSAFYSKYMERVKTMPEENKFSQSRPTSKTDLAGTKDRVRAAIIREQEEMASGSRTKTSSSSTSTSTSTSTKESSSSSSSSARSLESHSTSSRRKDLYDPQAERDAEEKKRREESKQRVKNRPAPPPPMDFHQLLKLAEKKQHEPVEIVVEEKRKEERLLTKRERREMEEQEKRKREKVPGMNGTVNKMQPNGRIPKLNGASSSASAPARPSNDKSAKLPSQPLQKASASSDTFKKPSNPAPSSRMDAAKSRPDSKSASSSSSNINSSNSFKPKSSQPNGFSSRPSDSSRPAPLSKTPSSSSQSSKPISKSSASASSSSSGSAQRSSQSKQPYNGPTREFPPREPYPPAKKSAQQPNGRSSDGGKVNGAASRDVQKTRQFPPPDVRRRPGPEPPRKQQQQAVKRRIYDDYDDDSEYDSELDDFIDDGPEEGANYSSYIKEIFGYDKSRYRDIDEDDAGMESSFAQQMREEFVSKKIGIMEDLEDMRMEEEEKKQKRLKKRKLK